MTKKKCSKEWEQVILGLVLTAFGAHLSIFANIGVAPWDTLGLGIASRTPWDAEPRTFWRSSAFL